VNRRQLFRTLIYAPLVALMSKLSKVAMEMYYHEQMKRGIENAWREAGYDIKKYGGKVTL